MSRAQFLKDSQEAAYYFQQFVRAKSLHLQEAALGTNPNEGWGQSDEAREAHSISMTLYHFTDEHFKNCTFPTDYGSPLEFQNKLADFVRMLERDKALLDEALSRLGAAAPMTVGMVLQDVNSALLAARETLSQLAEASRTTGQTLPDVILDSSPTPIDRIHEIANKFPDTVRMLSKRRSGRPALVIEDEYDVQYLFEAMLSVQFSDVRPEEATGSVAGGAGRADTYLKQERVAIEYKCTRAGLGPKDLRKQIADEFVLFGDDKRFDQLFVFVYDRERNILNRTGFESDLTRNVQGLREVRIVVRD